MGIYWLVPFYTREDSPRFQLPPIYRRAVPCYHRNAWWYALPPFHLLEQFSQWLRRTYENVVLETLIAGGWLVGPEGGYYSDFHFNWSRFRRANL